MIPFYMDENISIAITAGLRLRGVDVLTVQEDRRAREADPQILLRAIELDRVLVSGDLDMVHEAIRYQKFSIRFIGLVRVQQHELQIGAAISDLETYAKAGEQAILKIR